jgi:hypothetical protein
MVQLANRAKKTFKAMFFFVQAFGDINVGLFGVNAFGLVMKHGGWVNS